MKKYVACKVNIELLFDIMCAKGQVLVEYRVKYILWKEDYSAMHIRATNRNGVASLCPYLTFGLSYDILKGWISSNMIMSCYSNNV